MRVVVQRVKQAEVRIKDGESRSIGAGMLILLGIEEADDIDDINWLCGKLTNLRIFNDAGGVMNLSIRETGGEFMVISQFTLHASTKKGNRPAYLRAARPETAQPLYEQFLQTLALSSPKPIVHGEFGAHMEVSLLNDGPVTLLLDTKRKE